LGLYQERQGTGYFYLIGNRALGAHDLVFHRINQPTANIGMVSQLICGTPRLYKGFLNDVVKLNAAVRVLIGYIFLGGRQYKQIIFGKEGF